MIVKHGLVVAVAVLAATGISVTQADAAKKPKPTAVGCTVDLPPMCLGLKTKTKTYALFNTHPWIPVGTGVAVYGKVGDFSLCGATPIYVDKWEKTKQKCK